MCIQEFPLQIRIWKRGEKADTWAQCQPCRAVSNRQPFPLPSFLEPCAILGQKLLTVLLFTMLFLHSTTATMWHGDILKNGSDKSSPQCKLLPWLLMEWIFLIGTSWQDKNVYGCRGMEKLIFVQCEPSQEAKRWYVTSWTLTRKQECWCFHWWPCRSSPRGWSWWGKRSERQWR